MNREILLNSLEEFMEETDARLTALEAAKPQMDGAASCDEMLDTLLLSNADKRAAIANLTTELADLTRQRDNAWSAIDEYAEQRNTLAAQLDDLRNVNAGLRMENERLSSKVDTLTMQCNVLSVDNKNLREGNAELRKHYTNRNDLCAALQKQNATLWESNGALRKENERQWAVCETNNAQLRAALEEVEWCDDACPWCGGRSHGLGHSLACHRQAALR